MIRSLLYKFHKWVWDHNQNQVAVPGGLKVRESEQPDIDGMRFTVMVAEGGTIIQMRTYDRRKDQSDNKTYVIPDSEEDVAHRIGQIVALELIKL